MDASDVQLKLPTTGNNQPLLMVYEVCICQNSGRMFLAAAVDTDGSSNCASQQDMCA